VQLELHSTKQPNHQNAQMASQQVVEQHLLLPNQTIVKMVLTQVKQLQFPPSKLVLLDAQMAHSQLVLVDLNHLYAQLVVLNQLLQEHHQYAKMEQLDQHARVIFHQLYAKMDLQLESKLKISRKLLIQEVSRELKSLKLNKVQRNVTMVICHIVQIRKNQHAMPDKKWTTHKNHQNALMVNNQHAVMANNQALVLMEKLQLTVFLRLPKKLELRNVLMVRSQHVQVELSQLFALMELPQLEHQQNVSITNHHHALIRKHQAHVQMDHLLLLQLKLELKLQMLRVRKLSKPKKPLKVLPSVVMARHLNVLMALNQKSTKLQLLNLLPQHALMERNHQLVLVVLISQNL